MTRVLNLQRMAADTTMAMALSVTSSHSDCCKKNPALSY